MTECLQAQGAHAGLADAAVEYARRFPESWLDYRRGVDLLAHCVALAEQDVRLSTDQRRAAVDAYTGRAKQILREAATRLREEWWIRRNGLIRCMADHPEESFREPAAAVALAVKAVQLTPKVAGLWNTLGLAHYRAGDGKEALKALSRAAACAKTAMVRIGCA